MRGLGSNAASNFAAGLIGSVVLFATTPILVRGLGTEHYGLLVVAASIMGYFGVLDINMTSGSIKYMSESAAQRDGKTVNAIFLFGAVIYACIGVVGAGAIWTWSPELVGWLVKSPIVLRELAVEVFRVTAIGFLAAQLYTYLMSVPQALQRYDISARTEICMGIGVPVATAAMVVLGLGLVEISWVRVLSFALGVAVLLAVARRLVSGFRMDWPDASLRAKLFHFSAFAYLNRLASLTYQHGDKLIVAAMLDVGAVALYAVPSLVANRVYSSTFRISQVLFPAVSALLGQGRTQDVSALVLRSTRFVFAINCSVFVLFVAFGAPLLGAWVGVAFADTGHVVLVLIAAGALVDSLTNAPALVTDGSGRPRITGIAALARAAVGIGGVWAGAKLAGLEGVAASHLIVSSVFTTVFIYIFATRVFPMSIGNWLLESVLPGLAVAAVGLMFASGGAAFLSGNVWAEAANAMLTGALMAWLIWHFVLAATERRTIARLFRRAHQ